MKADMNKEFENFDRKTNRKEKFESTKNRQKKSTVDSEELRFIKKSGKQLKKKIQEMREEELWDDWDDWKDK